MSSKTKDNLILIVQGCKQVTVGLRAFILKGTERTNPSAGLLKQQLRFILKEEHCFQVCLVKETSPSLLS